MITLSKSDLASLSKKYVVNSHEIFILLSDILKLPYSTIFFLNNFELTNEEFILLQSYLKRRESKEPISKIIEKKEFYGVNYITTKDTLDPRPETELIVDLFLNYYQDTKLNLKILDLGCGTGCIGLTILGFYKYAVCDFVDISPKALDIAKRNAKALDLTDRANFNISDWFSNISNKYDVIVSNPPYISRSYNLDAEVWYDPEIALFAEDEGMSAINLIVSKAEEFLNVNGMLFIEIGFDQSEKIRSVKTDLQLVKIEKDLSNIDRIAVFKKRDID